MRAKKKMLVPLKPQQNTNSPSTNRRKVVSMTRKTIEKTPYSRMQKKIEEEDSSRHKGELLSSDLLERSDDNNEDDDGTDIEDKNCYGNDGGDRNNGAGGGSVEFLGFLIPSVLTEAFDAMAKAKATSSTKLRKTRSWEKVRIK